MKPKPCDLMHSLSPAGASVPALEELEIRLEAQMLDIPATLDDGDCIYYLCTTRCTDTKCTGFGE